jgi:hypothetical protein
MEATYHAVEGLVLNTVQSRAISAADEKFKNWNSEHNTELQNEHKVSERVYHYTDAAGLQGILKNQSFWCTSVYYLNDPSELEYGLSLARATLCELKKDNDKRIKCIAQGFENELRGDWHKCFGLYPLSFSLKENDLGQWRAYGDDGKGFCIGFSPQIADPALPNSYAFRLEYNEAATKKRMMAGARQAADICKCAEDAVASKLAQEECFPFTQNLVKKIAIRLNGFFLLHAAIAKHGAYDNEAEIRLLIFNAKENLEHLVDTRVRGSQIIPFVKRPMNTETIVSLMVGPSSNVGAEDAAVALLRTVNIVNVIPTRSSIPYRS